MEVAKLLKLAVLVTVLTMVIMTVFGRRGLFELQRMKDERDSITARIEKLKRENRHHRTELESLGKDRHYIEDIARRELGYVREGETVYRFRDEGR